MNFLIDEDLPRSTGDVIRRYGHGVVDIRDSGLRGSQDSVVAEYARNNKLCVLTGDLDFAHIKNYPPAHYFGIVVLRPPRDAGADDILNLVESFLMKDAVVDDIVGCLAIIEEQSIRIRK